MVICAFTGHRLIQAEEALKIEKTLDLVLEKLIGEGLTECLCGGAVGFDTLAAQAVLRKHDRLKLKLILPCEGQEARWNEKQQAVYRAIRAQADEVEVLFPVYVTGCMHARDRALVEQADQIVTFYRGRPGGTGYTLRLAREMNKTIIYL